MGEARRLRWPPLVRPEQQLAELAELELELLSVRSAIACAQAARSIALQRLLISKRQTLEARKVALEEPRGVVHQGPAHRPSL